MLQFNATDTALIGLAGVLVGGLIGNRLTVGREASLRRRAFRDTIRRRLVKMDSVPDEKLIEFYHESIPEVRNECVSVREDVVPWKRSRFGRALDGYCGLHDEEISNYDPKQVVYTIFGGGDGHTKTRRGLTNYRKGRRRIFWFLRELIKCAK